MRRCFTLIELLVSRKHLIIRKETAMRRCFTLIELLVDRVVNS